MRRPFPFLRRAIELDPNFAMAYARLAVAYGNLGQPRSIATLTAEKHYCNFAYSALACFRMGMSGSASFQSMRKF